MPLMSLPNELLDNIVDRIAHNAPGSLKSTALISRYFLDRCRYHLFHTIRFSASESNSKLRKMLAKNPALFCYPRTLRITQCFDFLLCDQFVVDGGLLSMVDRLDSLRNLHIVDEEHPDSIPHWDELGVGLQAAYRALLARPLIHLSICLPKGFPDHLISSISTLQTLEIDDVTDSLGDRLEVEEVSSDSSWSLRSLQHCHRGVFCTLLLRSMSPPHPMFAKLTSLTLDITRLEGHVYAWSDMPPAFRKQLLSLCLKYTGPSSRYPGNGNKNIGMSIASPASQKLNPNYSLSIRRTWGRNLTLSHLPFISTAPPPPGRATLLQPHQRPTSPPRPPIRHSRIPSIVSSLYPGRDTSTIAVDLRR